MNKKTGKTITINEDLENRLSDIFEGELDYLINHADCPNEFVDDISAQIEVLRLLGHDTTASKYATEYMWAICENIFLDDSLRKYIDAITMIVNDFFDKKANGLKVGNKTDILAFQREIQQEIINLQDLLLTHDGTADADVHIDDFKDNIDQILTEYIKINVLPETLLDKDNPNPTKLGKHLYLNLSDVQIDTLDEILDSGILQADNSGCIADAVSDETGWCVYSTSYRIICKPDIDD